MGVKRKRTNGGYRQNRRKFYKQAVERMPLSFSFRGRVTSYGELKFLDNNKSATTAGASGTIFNDTINIIPQNATESGRNGRKVTVRSVHIKGEIVLPATATSSETADLVRVMIYWDKQCNGATATVANLLESGTPLGFRALENTGRFRILMDEVFDMKCGSGGGSTAAFGADRRYFSRSIKCNIPLEFDATASTGVLTMIRSNNLGVFCSSRQGISTVAYTTRIRYSDV